MRAWLSGWRLALRIATREAWRAKARSALVIVMILIPALGVTAADVVIRTSQLSAVESVPRYMGAAAARVELLPGVVEQRSINPFSSPDYEGHGRRPRASLDDLGSLVRGRATTPIDETYPAVDVTDGQTTADLELVDPRNPLTAGLFRLREGRWPTSSDEIVINPTLAAHGPGIGQQLVVRAARHVYRRTVVGIADSTLSKRADVAIALPRSLPITSASFPAARGYLVGGGPISWQQVRAWNAHGALVFSRAVAASPPDLSAYGSGSALSSAEISIVLLIVVMALLEVVLLAGPALAVGAKRQSRTLALLATAGGTPAQGRRVILGTGLVLGAVGAIGGVLLGIPTARLAQPAAQRLSANWLGPFDVRWHELVVIGLFGLASALAAAVVPAWIASRQDVVAILAGRRGDRRPGLRSPLLGVLLLAAGILAAAEGTRLNTDEGAALISAGTLLCVLGMILLVGLVVAGAARLGTRLPVPLRFAVRDADRHRTRMVPAVAAVAATVAGLTSVGIAFASYDAKQEALYLPQLRIGQALVQGDSSTNWSAISSVIDTRLDHPTLTPIDSVAAPGGAVRGAVQENGRRVPPPMGFRANGSPLIVTSSEEALPPGMSTDQTEAAERAWAAGGAVVWTDRARPAGTARIVVHAHNRVVMDARVPTAFLVPPNPGDQWGSMMLSPRLAQRHHLATATGALMVSGTRMSGSSETTLADTLNAMAGHPFLYVERGFVAPSFIRILRLVLFVLGGFLVIGGTLTATYLSLADARPDLATLAAVGAGGATRRLVAAAYALAVSSIGAVLGALVGLVPGIAIVHPINDPAGATGELYLTLPWALIAVVVLGLPVAMSLTAGLASRGRLPMVARLQ